MSEFEFYEARIRAEWQDWTFAAHEAAARAAAAEELIALRRQYTELSEPDLLQLADSWRLDDASGPYFTFTAADGSLDDDPGAGQRNATGPAVVAVDATFVKALFHELDDRVPAALAALIDLWDEQRQHVGYAGLRPAPAEPPRVAVLLPRDESQWPPGSWTALLELDLTAPQFDGALLRWDGGSELWSARDL